MSSSSWCRASAPRPVLTLAQCGPTLPRDFYERPTLEVAPDLIGKRLCVLHPNDALQTGLIVEVEAYLGTEDRASHARLQKRGGSLVPSARSSLMFGPVGLAYVYLIYGLHHCVNVVAHAPGAVGAILIRALRPEGSLAQKSCSGPAKLCAQLGIDRRHNGSSLLGTVQPAPTDAAGQPLAQIFIATPSETPAPLPAQVRSGPRIGVAYAGPDALLPYRFGLANDPDLSRPL